MSNTEEYQGDLPCQKLPDGWGWVTIGDLVNKLVGGCSTKKSDYLSEGILVLNKGHIKANGVVDLGIQKRYVSKKYASNNLARVVANGTVLVTLRDLSVKADFLGLIARYRGTEQALITQGMCSLDLKESVLPNYLIHYSNAFVYRVSVKEMKVGSTQVHLRNGVFLGIGIPLPPLKEQKRIVAEIEKQFSRLDEAVANLKRVKVKLKRYKAAVLKAAVEGKLTEEWRKQHPDVEPAGKLLERILVERREKWQGRGKYKEPVAPDTTDLPELPAGWTRISIEQVADVGTGATPLRSKSEYYDRGDIPWITSGALNEEYVTTAKEYVTDLAVQETNVKIFPSHTLLVAMYGEGKTRGKVSELLINATTNQACAAIVLDGLSQNIRDYIKLFFLKNYGDIRRLSSGGVQPNLNLTHIKKTLIPFPSLAEQHKIVTEVKSLFCIVSSTEAQLDANLHRAERLRQSILKKAFSGQLIPQISNKNLNSHTKELANNV